MIQQASLFTNMSSLELKSFLKQCLAGKGCFLDQQVACHLQRRTNMAAKKFYAKYLSFLSWKEDDLPPSSSKRLTGMYVRVIKLETVENKQFNQGSPKLV